MQSPVAPVAPAHATVPAGPTAPTGPAPVAPTTPMPAVPTAPAPTAPAHPAPPALPVDPATAAPGPQGDLAVPFWTPRTVTVVASTLRDGMVPAVVDALRGGHEAADGQRLSVAQVATLAPFLAHAYARPVVDVTRDLRDVRIRTGGPAAGLHGWAVTFGPSIYVNSGREVGEILDWSGRRWLSHELGHTMQWGRIDAASDETRTRLDLARYAGGYVHAAGPGHGAVVDAATGWIGDRLHHVPVADRKTMSQLLHDTHPMEHEAEAHAQEFLRLTSLAPTGRLSKPRRPRGVPCSCGGQAARGRAAWLATTQGSWCMQVWPTGERHRRDAQRRARSPRGAIALLVALVIAALAALAPAADAATPKTVLTFARPAVRMSQHGGKVAWIERTKGRCALAVFVLTLPKGPVSHVGGCIPSDYAVPNCTTCHDLDIALGSSGVMWTQLQRSGVGVSINVKRATFARPGQAIQVFGFHHELGGGPGTYLTGFTGSGSALLYSTARFLGGGDLPCPTDASKSCTIVSSGGGVFDAGRPFPDGPTVRLLAAAGSDAAWVPYPLGAVTADTTDQVHVASSTGIEAATIETGGTVHALAATATTVTAIVTPAAGPMAGTRTLALWDIASGSAGPRWQVAVPAGTQDRLAADGSAIVLQVGAKAIAAASATSGALRTLGSASAAPVGLSISGCRVLWLEPFKKGSRMRSLAAC